MSESFEAFAARSPASLVPLDRVGWLAEQEDDFRAFVLREARWRQYDAGQFVYHAGDPPDGLYGLASGALDITFPLVAEEPVTVHRAEVGFWIGDNAEFAEHGRLVSIMAAVPSRLLHLPGRPLRRLLAEQPRHWRAIYRLSSRNVETAIRALSEALALTVRARVCRRLLALAVQSSEVPITQSELATLVGVTRATLQRCLSDLAGEGGIERRYGSVCVSDPAVLRSYVDEQ